MARILLAEDDEAMRTFLTRALEKGGHKVHAVGDGLEALPAIAQDRFDLLVADVVMPGMDGIELARRATREIADLKVIFITGFAAVAMRLSGSTQKNARVFSKPFHLRELVDEIEKVLRVPTGTEGKA